MLATIDEAIRLGLPDATDATLHAGQLVLDADDRDSVRCFLGLHARRPDGAWIANLERIVVPGPGERRDQRPLKAWTERTLAAVMHELAANIDSQHGDEEWPLRLVPERYAATAWPMIDALRRREQGRLVSSHLCFLSGRPAAQSALFCAQLMRLGYADAEWLAVESALIQAEEPEVPVTPFSPWTGLSLDQPGSAASSGIRGMQVANPAVALRRGLAQWFHHQALYGDRQRGATDTVAEAERMLDGWLALADPVDEAMRLDHARLKALHHLPAAVPDQADLATRLTAWRTDMPGFWYDRHATGESDLAWVEEVARWPTGEVDHTLRDQDMEHVKPYLKAMAASRLSLGNLDALIALVGDTRPSRWLDVRGERPRTIGDQALRAIASLLFVDPRHFVGHNPNAPWNEAERAAVARDLSAWWAMNREKPLAEVIDTALPRMQPKEIDQLLQCTRDEARTRVILDRLVVLWDGRPPFGDLKGLLMRHRDHPGFAALVDGWPLAGPQAATLALWHAARGRRQHLERLVLDALGETRPTSPCHIARERVVSLALMTPTPAVLKRLQDILAAAPDTPMAACIRSSLGDPTTDDEFLAGLMSSEKNRLQSRGQHTMCAALVAQLLADRRPTPVAAPQGAMNLLRSSSPPATRRAADDMALELQRHWWNLIGEGSDAPGYLTSFREDLPVAERDQILAKMLNLLSAWLPERLKMAGLPLSIPGVSLADDPSADLVPGF